MPIEPQATSVTTPAQAPKAPVTIITSGPGGAPQTLVIPQTAAEMHALRMQREELSDQLSGVAARRRDLAEELQSFSDGATRTGLEGRLSVLDQRIVQLETDLATTGRQISSASAELIAETSERPSQPSGGGDFEEGLTIGGGSVLFAALVGFFVLRKLWKRRGPSLPAVDGESGRRLERLELGMEAIAVEIERISEGQRFVTRLLSEAQMPAQPAAIAAHGSSTKSSVGRV